LILIQQSVMMHGPYDVHKDLLSYEWFIYEWDLILTTNWLKKKPHSIHCPQSPYMTLKYTWITFNINQLSVKMRSNLFINHS
jgi:hypothetical protein